MFNRVTRMGSHIFGILGVLMYQNVCTVGEKSVLHSV